jgi:hypothetical protein
MVKAYQLEYPSTPSDQLEYPSLHPISDRLYLIYDGAHCVMLLEWDPVSKTFSEYKTLPCIKSHLHLNNFVIKSCLFDKSKSELNVLLYTCQQEAVEWDDQRETQAKERIKTRFYLSWVIYNVITETLMLACRVKSFTAPFYAFIQDKGEALIVVSEQGYECETIPLESSQDLQLVPTLPAPTFNYFWNQSEEELTVHIHLQDPIPANKWDIKFTSRSIKVHALPPNELDLFSFKDTLFDSILPAECLWTIEQDRLITLHLQKANPETTWRWVFVEEDSQKEIKDRNQVGKLLESLVDAGQGVSEAAFQQPLNSDMEIEDLEGQMVVFSRFTRGLLDPVSHQVSIPSTLSHSNHAAHHEWIGESLYNDHLFTDPVSLQHPAFCLKYDVDGLIYSMVNPSTLEMQHIATVPALAYVKNSKRDKRFLFVTADYAIILESSRYLYCYNYKSGQIQSQQFILDLNQDACIRGPVIADFEARKLEVLGVQYIPSSRQLVVLKDSAIVCVKL